jgi:hypothetical protein
LSFAELCAGRGEDPAEISRLIDEGLLPQPSYMVDGIRMFPSDYFRLYHEAGGVTELRDLLERRYRAAAAPHAHLASPEAVDQAWQAYLGGIWGICLRVTPELVVRKQVLVDSLSRLLALSRPQSPQWRQQVRAQVTELDQIEREFAPDYDRADWNERPPTRDLLIRTAHERFPEVFAGEHAASRRAAAAR